MSEIRKIENFAAPELDVYARLSEPQLLHYYEPQPGLFLAESPRVIERALDVGYEPVSFLAGSAELAANAARFRLWRKSAGMPAAWRFWKMS